MSTSFSCACKACLEHSVASGDEETRSAGRMRNHLRQSSAICLARLLAWEARSAEEEDVAGMEVSAEFLAMLRTGENRSR